MHEIIEKIRARLEAGAYPNEASVSTSIVTPILSALGWDTSDPEQFIPEYSSGGRRVDIALCGTAKRPNVFIEVKAVGLAMNGDRQLFEYAFHEGIPFCILTDGKDWHFYLPSGQGNYDERRVYRLQITERTAAECTTTFSRYLLRSRVKSGEALDDATRDYRDVSSRREAGRNIPKAWAQLVSQPEDLLVELLCEQTEALSGFRPTYDEAILFLRSLSTGPMQGAAPKKMTPDLQSSVTQKSSPTKPEQPRQKMALPANRAVEFHVFGKKYQAANGSGALTEILTILADKYPEKIDAIARAARGKSRNHIAQTAAEIYPKRPDLARAYQFHPGWLIGLNIANREKIRIIRATCQVIGVRFGTDVIIDLPNSGA
jgi:predicted type IV restriction endonuclease